MKFTSNVHSLIYMLTLAFISALISFFSPGSHVIVSILSTAVYVTLLFGVPTVIIARFIDHENEDVRFAAKIMHTLFLHLFNFSLIAAVLLAPVAAALYHPESLLWLVFYYLVLYTLAVSGGLLIMSVAYPEARDMEKSVTDRHYDKFLEVVSKELEGVNNGKGF